ncbi:hypothetical protein [Actinoalloteichus caeruleus]|uniref:hypothetical protein n=1 Tax=Actinoalloteichus cyanogriseus TaxID=2893586 RepID=UPI0004AA482A|nr:hypothetical protein [Actinoalloteichus caeruleus]
MPIRTNRGRAAVYRKLWGWPLRSPRHLTATVVLLLAAVVGVGVVVSDGMPFAGDADQGQAGPSASPTPPAGEEPGAGPFPTRIGTAEPPATTTTTPWESAEPPSISVPDLPPESAAPDPEGLAVAEAWMRAWVTHAPGDTTEQWLAGMEEYTTDEYLTIVGLSDPDSVLADAVTGDPVPVESTTTSMRVRVPTDAGEVELLLMTTDQGWRVSGHNPVE